jgi:hypothetical protein
MSFGVKTEFEIADKAFRVTRSPEFRKRDFTPQVVPLNSVEDGADAVQRVLHLRTADSRQWCYTTVDGKRQVAVCADNARRDDESRGHLLEEAARSFDVNVGGVGKAASWSDMNVTPSPGAANNDPLTPVFI